MMQVINTQNAFGEQQRGLQTESQIAGKVRFMHANERPALIVSVDLCGLSILQLAFPLDLNKPNWRLINPVFFFFFSFFSMLSRAVGSGTQHDIWKESLILTALLTFKLLCYHSPQSLIYSSGALIILKPELDRKKIICSLNRKKVYTPQTKRGRQ